MSVYVLWLHDTSWTVSSWTSVPGVQPCTDYMRNKCGVQQSVRNRLVTKTLEDGGLLNTDDSVAFTEAADVLANDCGAVLSTLGQHFRPHVEPALRQFVFQPRQQHPWVRRRCNNDAAESINHILKLSIEWHPRRLPELIDRLYKVLSVQWPTSGEPCTATATTCWQNSSAVAGPRMHRGRRRHRRRRRRCSARSWLSCPKWRKSGQWRHQTAYSRCRQRRRLPGNRASANVRVQSGLAPITDNCYWRSRLRDQSVRLCVCKITDELLTDIKLVYSFVYVFIASVCVSLR